MLAGSCLDARVVFVFIFALIPYWVLINDCLKEGDGEVGVGLSTEPASQLHKENYYLGSYRGNYTLFGNYSF